VALPAEWTVPSASGLFYQQPLSLHSSTLRWC